MLINSGTSVQKEERKTNQITSDDVSETCLQSDLVGQNQKTNLFNVPGVLVGLGSKSASECDSVRSPTSPLDANLFPNRLSKKGGLKKWDCDKVGLSSIVDSLDECDYGTKLSVKPVPLSNSSTILTRVEAPKSLPKNYPIFPKTKLRPSNLQKESLETDSFEKTQCFSLDSNRLGSEIYRLGTRTVDLGKQNFDLGKECVSEGSDSDLFGQMLLIGEELARPLSPEEIELSEDYTCVISHGPVPKTTHIFCDCVLDSYPNGADIGIKSEKCCEKKLEDDAKDIFIGEYSWDCFLKEISIEEKQEELIDKATKSENGDNSFDKSF